MISLITPTMGDISERTIISVFKQTCLDFEWVIVVDSSKNITPIVHRDIKIKIVSLGANYGPSVARNVGIQVADGDIITYLDSDDTLEPNRIERLNNIYKERKDIDILFSSYIIIDGDRQAVASHTENAKLIANGSLPLYFTILRAQNISIPMGVSHTRKLFFEQGGFQRGIVCGEDGILWRRMCEKGARISVDELIAGTYYVNTNGQSRTQRRFDMGGFAFNGEDDLGSNGQYLDEDWYKTYNSVRLFDEKP